MRNRLSFGVSLLAVFLLLSSAELYGRGMECVGYKSLNPYDYVEHTNIMPLLNYKARVYQIWVNGNEDFYYRCDTGQIGEILGLFVEAKPNVRDEALWKQLVEKNPEMKDANSVRRASEGHVDLKEVVLCPGPAQTQTFSQDVIPYNVNLHIVGGVCGFLPTLEKGGGVWNRFPVLSIYVSDANQLEKITYPEEVTIVQLGDLKDRKREALSSSDRTVRGWGAGNLARLDPYDEESLAAIIKLLDDPDDWVRVNAAGAVRNFGRLAEPAIPALQRCAQSSNEQLSKVAAESLESIGNAECRIDEQKRHNELLQRIAEFVKSRKEHKRE